MWKKLKCQKEVEELRRGLTGTADSYLDPTVLPALLILLNAYIILKIKLK